MKKLFLKIIDLSVIAFIGCASVDPVANEPIDQAIIGKWGSTTDGKGSVWEFRANGTLKIGGQTGGLMYKFAASKGNGIYGMKLDSSSAKFTYSIEGDKMLLYIKGINMSFINTPDQEYDLIKIK